MYLDCFVIKNRNSTDTENRKKKYVGEIKYELIVYWDKGLLILHGDKGLVNMRVTLPPVFFGLYT